MPSVRRANAELDRPYGLVFVNSRYMDRGRLVLADSVTASESDR